MDPNSVTRLSILVGVTLLTVGARWGLGTRGRAALKPARYGLFAAFILWIPADGALYALILCGGALIAAFALAYRELRDVTFRLGKLYSTPRVVPGEKSVSPIGLSGRTTAEEIPAPKGVERALVGWRLKKPDGWWLSGRVDLESEIGPAQLELGNTTLCQCCVVKGTPFEQFHEIPPATDCYIIGAPAWEAVPTDEYRDNEWIAVFGTKDQAVQVYFHSRQMVARRAWSTLASVLLWLLVTGEAAWARLVAG